MPATARIRILAGALAAGALLAVLALLPGPAGAQGAAKPTPCGGEPLLTDKAGDQSIDPLAPIDVIGLGLLAHEGPPNADITSAFLSFTGGKLTANIEVTNLDKSIPSITDSQGGIAYYAFWSFGGAVHFVRAQNQDGTEFTYGYGTADPASGVYTTDGTTTGTAFEGPKGIIQIEIPAAAGGAAGNALKGVVAAVDGFFGGPDDASGFNNHIDLAPDNADVLDPNGKDFEVAECAAGPSGTTPAGGVSPATTVLPLKVSKVLDGAKKAKKKKALRISVSASEAITNLSVSLKPKNGKGKTYASAKLAKVSGTATMKMKLKAKLKAGSYALVAKGTVGGTARKATIAVKVKK